MPNRKAVLNDDDDVANVSGYSFVGHIIHLNLREELEPYKYVIGQIFLHLPNVTTVVNKTTAIDNTYRNFSMEKFLYVLSIAVVLFTTVVTLGKCKNIWPMTYL